MNISLSKWTMDDLDILVKYAGNPKIANNMRDVFPSPYGMEDGVRFIKITESHDPTQIFAISMDGQPIGSIGIFPQNDIYRKNAELGYWLAEPYWGKGIVLKAIALMLEYAFNTWDIYRVYAIPFGTNLASQRALEKAGFVLEARFQKTILKNGEMLDELIYAIRKENKALRW